MVTWYSVVTERRSHRSGRNLILDTDKCHAGANSKGCACKYAICLKDTSNAVVCVFYFYRSATVPGGDVYAPVPAGIQEE